MMKSMMMTLDPKLLLLFMWQRLFAESDEPWESDLQPAVKRNPSFVKEIAEIVDSSFWNCISFKPKLNLFVGQAKMQ